MWVRFLMPVMDWKKDDIADLDHETAEWLVNIGKAVQTAPPAPVVEAAAVEPAERAVKPAAKKRTR